MSNKLTREHKNKILDKCDESVSGRVLIPKSAITIYRKFSEDYSSSDLAIKLIIGNMYCYENKYNATNCGEQRERN